MDPSSLPALPPPPGVSSNFDHPRTEVSSIIIVNCVSIVIMVVFVNIQLYTKVRITRSFPRHDDSKFSTYFVL